MLLVIYRTQHIARLESETQEIEIKRLIAMCFSHPLIEMRRRRVLLVNRVHGNDTWLVGFATQSAWSANHNAKLRCIISRVCCGTVEIYRRHFLVIGIRLSRSLWKPLPHSDSVSREVHILGWLHAIVEVVWPSMMISFYLWYIDKLINIFELFCSCSRCYNYLS